MSANSNSFLLPQSCFIHLVWGSSYTGWMLPVLSFMDKAS